MNSRGGQEHEAARLSLGAYVLGGLGPAQRGEVERHTATCSACQAELAGLAIVPSLLRRIDPLAQTSPTGTPAGRLGGERAAEPGSDPDLLTRLMDQVRAERARRRQQFRRLRIATALGAVAAVASLAVTVGTSVVRRPSRFTRSRTSR